MSAEQDSPVTGARLFPLDVTVLLQSLNGNYIVRRHPCGTGQPLRTGRRRTGLQIRQRYARICDALECIAELERSLQVVASRVGLA